MANDSSTAVAADGADLLALVELALGEAKTLGASQAEAAISMDVGLSVSVRLGEVETIEYQRDRGMAVTVYFGTRKGSASTADLSAAALRETVAKACSIARFTAEDPCAGIADPDTLATDIPDLDLAHPWDVTPERACELALEGIICKRADAPYVEARSRTWLKVKCSRRQEFVVIGWSPPSGSRKHLGSLLLGELCQRRRRSCPGYVLEQPGLQRLWRCIRRLPDQA